MVVTLGCLESDLAEAVDWADGLSLAFSSITSMGSFAAAFSSLVALVIFSKPRCIMKKVRAACKAVCMSFCCPAGKSRGEAHTKAGLRELT